MNTRRLLAWLFAIFGIALFAWLLSHADLPRVWAAMLTVGLPGFAAILALYAVEYLCDVEAWRLMLGRAFRPWSARLYLVRMTGEAYNTITPAGGMGGEPLKALILKRRYDVPYTESGASLVLAKTINVIALVLFLAGGFFFMLGDARVGPELQWLAATGLAALSIGVGGFILVQRLRMTSRIAAKLGPRAARAAAALGEFDQHLVSFYTRDPVRFVLTVLLGLINWLLGTAAVWVSLHLMGEPVSFADAWVIEAMVQMVRAATFFIPASLGAQEAIIMVVTGAITGDPGQGLAVALLRRGRELLWVLAGLALSAPLLNRRVAHD